MTTPQTKNPYKPGFGVRPPYFAGRQNETEVIRSALDAIQGGAGPMADAPDPAMVLTGPRGVGKTVLLTRAIKEAQSRGIQTATISPTLLSGPRRELVSRVPPTGLLKGIFDKVDKISLESMQAGLAVDLKEAERDMRSAVPAFMAKKPLLLIMDEAHRCRPKVLNLLFEIVQDCLSADLPLAVVLAGTPGIVTLLQGCEATYVERSEIIRFNTLSGKESTKALELPAKDRGRPIRPAALKLLLDWADNHPFFIQKAGRHAWDASVARSGKDITVADAKQGLNDADTERNGFYSLRHQELKRRGLGEFAVQVAGILRGNKGVSNHSFVEKALMSKNEGMDEKRAIMVAEQLLELGYLWHTGDGLEPGIPSLFNYVVKNH